MLAQIKHVVFKNEFSVASILFFVCGIVPFLFFSKGDIVLFINTHIANSVLDHFFFYYTIIGDGYVFGLAIILLLFFSYRQAAQLCCIGFLILLVSVLFKQVFFNDALRPVAYFSADFFSHINQDFYYERKFSFPSGHTMSAFGLATFFSYIFTQRYIRIGLFIIAFGVAFSRMYLLKHFYVDIYFGALFGFLLSVPVLFFSSFFNRIPEKGLFQTFNLFKS